MATKKFLNVTMKGLTLAEMIVALGVFVILSTIITELFTQAVHAQRQTTEQQKLQNDLRFTMESIATDARIGVVDYNQTIVNPQSTLNLLDEDRQRITYALSSAGDARCPDTASSPCVLKTVGDPAITANTAAITRKGVRVNKMIFAINPITKSAIPTTVIQPTVTIVIEMQSIDPKSAGRSIVLQTTVTEKGKP